MYTFFFKSKLKSEIAKNFKNGPLMSAVLTDLKALSHV